MLALTRKSGESLVITVGEIEIVVKVAQIKNLNRIVLGVEAPRELVTIDRAEVHERRKREKAAAENS